VTPWRYFRLVLLRTREQRLMLAKQGGWRGFLYSISPVRLMMISFGMLVLGRLLSSKGTEASTADPVAKSANWMDDLIL